MTGPKRYKFCRSCQQSKTVEDYYLRSNGYLSAWCRPCTSAANNRKRDERRAAERAVRLALPPAQRKTCTQCHEEKAVADFYGRQAECKACSLLRRQEYEARPEVRRHRALAAIEYRERTRHLRRARGLKRYGITPDRYDELFDGQDGKCAICSARGERLGTGGAATRKTVLCVDHCHGSGAVRGLLCHSCNRGVGLLSDSPQRLRDAAAYIEKRGR